MSIEWFRLFLYNMKQTILYRLIVLIVVNIITLTTWADIEINQKNFPDANFRDYLLSQDYGKDGIIDNIELSRLYSLSLYNKGISDLKGIELLSELKFIDCPMNNLTSIDITHNPKLVGITCNDNKLTELNVSKNPQMQRLLCARNKLTQLDVSNLKDLSYLSCAGNTLDNLIVNNCTALTELSCYDSELKQISLTNCTALKTLTLYNNKLTEIDISTCSALEELRLEENSLTKIDVSKNKMLISLDVEENQLSELDIKGCISLESLACGGTNLFTTIDFSGHPSLKNVYCSVSKSLKSMIAKDCKRLESINAYYSKIEEIDVTGCTALTFIELDHNSVKTLDASTCTALETLHCPYNGLSELNVTGLKYLKTLVIYWNKLEKLDITTCPELTELNCYGNRLKELDVTKNPKLTILDCSSNDFSTLDVTHNPELESLICSGLKLNSLDVSQNQRLVSLECHSNQLLGESMDKIIKDLPITTNGIFRAINDYFDYGYKWVHNVVTTEQVNAALQKGWTTYHFEGDTWYPYEGSESAGINDVMDDMNYTETIYTLSGQRLTMPQKGINIINGKKVLVK